MNYAIAAMVITAIMAGGLGALWDSHVLRRRLIKSVVVVLSWVCLYVAYLYWVALSPDISHFWWYQASGQHVIPKMAVIRASPSTLLYAQLFAALVVYVGTLFVPILLSYFWTVRRIAVRQQRKDAQQASSNE